MTLVFGLGPALDDEVVAHMTWALQRYLQWCDTDAQVPVPGRLRSLVRQLISVRRGQQGPRVELGPIPDHTANSQLLFDTAAVARLLDVSESTVKRLYRDGLLPTVKVYGSRRVRLVDLKRYVEELEHHPPIPEERP